MSKVFSVILALVVFLTFLTCFSTTQSALADQQTTIKPRVMVIVIDSRRDKNWSNWGSNTPFDDIWQKANSVLAGSQKFVVIANGSRRDTWIEQNLGASGRMDPRTVARVGKTQGASHFLVLYVQHFSVTGTGGAAASGNIFGVPLGGAAAWATWTLQLTAEVIEVETGTAVWGSSEPFTGTEPASAAAIRTNGVFVAWGSSPAGKATTQALQKVSSALPGEFATNKLPDPPATFAFYTGIEYKVESGKYQVFLKGIQVGVLQVEAVELDPAVNRIKVSGTVLKGVFPREPFSVEKIEETAQKGGK